MTTRAAHIIPRRVPAWLTAGGVTWNPKAFFPAPASVGNSRGDHNADGGAE